MRVIVLTLLAAAVLAACDAQRIEKLEEGLSTEADVRRQFGEPTLVVEKADGSKVLEYPRQPAGWTNYLIVIAADGKMSSLRQLLTPTSVARITAGMDRAEVRRQLGKPARERRYAMKPDEDVWQWRFMHGNQKKVFSVTFDRDQRVIATETTEEHAEDQAGGK